MFLFIIGIIVLIVGVALAIAMASDGSKAAALSTVVVAVFVAAILITMSCTVTVPTGHTGVITTFGRVEDRTLDAGFSFKAPWQKVVKLDNRTQKQTISLSCFSSDIQEVSMVYTINYQISQTEAMTIYRTIGKNYYETIIVPAVSESVKTVSAQYTAEDLVALRNELAQKIEQDLTEKLAAYNIQIIDTSIEDTDFTDEFTDAVEAKQVAQQNKLRAETEAAQRVVEADAAAAIARIEADADAYEIIAKAQAEAEAARIRAEAEAEANQKISASLTKDLIDYVYAQQWDGKYPTYMGSDGMSLILNPGD